MRTDYQVADEIFKELDCDKCCGPMHSESMRIFRKHLTAYAEERVKEARAERDKNFVGVVLRAGREGRRKARAEALEEAAKVADKYWEPYQECRRVLQEISAEIRALRSGDLKCPEK